jgi:hypothetical protein
MLDSLRMNVAFKCESPRTDSAHLDLDCAYQKYIVILNDNAFRNAIVGLRTRSLAPAGKYLEISVTYKNESTTI